MLRYIKKNPNLLLAILLGLWAVINIAMACSNNLSGAECYLWYIARCTDWSFSDISPLSMCFTWLGTALGGDNELSVRILFLLVEPAALYLFYRATARGRGSAGGAITYFLVSFSLPLLHIYGFFASDEVVFLLCAVVSLWAFDRFDRQGGLGAGVVLGVSFAWTLVSSSVGIFLILAILASRRSILLKWRFWVGVVACVAALSPFIWWQIEQGWPVVDHFLQPIEQNGRVNIFEIAWSILVWFNPLLVVPFLIVICQRRKIDAPIDTMERTMRVVFWVFVGVMLLSASRGAQTGLWITPICLSIIYVLTRAATRLKWVRVYLMIFCSVAVFILFCGRILLIVEPSTAQPLGVSSTKSKSIEVSELLRSKGVAHLLLEGDERNASALNFYSTLPTTALAATHRTPSLYAYHLSHTQLATKVVAVEISQRARESIAPDSLDKLFTPIELGAPDRKAYVSIIENFIPIYDIHIGIDNIPKKVLTGSRIALLLHIVNPYPYDIEIGGRSGNEIAMYIRELPVGQYHYTSLPFKAQTLPATSQTNITTTVQIPTVTTAHYSLGFSIEHFPLTSIYNSKVADIQIVNPKSRI